MSEIKLEKVSISSPWLKEDSNILGIFNYEDIYFNQEFIKCLDSDPSTTWFPVDLVFNGEVIQDVLAVVILNEDLNPEGYNK